MKSWETKTGTRIFMVLAGRSNAYLIIKGEQSFLVDTGKASAYKKLLRNFDALDFNIKDLSFLLLTHTHFDHCQSARRIKDASNCKVVVSEKAAGSVKNGYTKLPDGTLLITKLITKLGQAIGKRKFGYAAFEPDILIEGDQVKVSDHDIHIIETPGHSADSISIIADNEIAFVGDAMIGTFRNTIFPPFADDVETMVESWGKLLDTGCSIFLPGHGKEIKRTLLQREFSKRNYKISTKS